MQTHENELFSVLPAQGQLRGGGPKKKESEGFAGEGESLVKLLKKILRGSFFCIQ